MRQPPWRLMLRYPVLHVRVVQIDDPFATREVRAAPELIAREATGFRGSLHHCATALWAFRFSGRR